MPKCLSHCLIKRGVQSLSSLPSRSFTRQRRQLDLLPVAVRVLDQDRPGFRQENHLVDGGVERFGVIGSEDRVHVDGPAVFPPDIPVHPTLRASSGTTTSQDVALAENEKCPVIFDSGK